MRVPGPSACVGLDKVSKISDKRGATAYFQQPACPEQTLR
jgi:hypothetical protein